MVSIFENERPTRRFSREDYKTLRGRYDGNDTNMNRGMGIKAPRLMREHYRPEQDKPEAQFLYNNAGTQTFLLVVFPLLQTDRRQRLKAAKWNAVINYYFRLGYTDSRTERELGWKKGEVGYIVQQIRRRIKGLSPNGKIRSTRKRGRPRKVVVFHLPETTTETLIAVAA